MATEQINMVLIVYLSKATCPLRVTTMSDAQCALPGSLKAPHAAAAQHKAQHHALAIVVALNRQTYHKAMSCLKQICKIFCRLKQGGACLLLPTAAGQLFYH